MTAFTFRPSEKELIYAPRNGPEETFEFEKVIGRVGDEDVWGPVYIPKNGTTEFPQEVMDYLNNNSAGSSIGVRVEPESRVEIKQRM